MEMKTLAKVLALEESGLLLDLEVRSGVSSLGTAGTWRTWEDELASLSNPIFSLLKTLLLLLVLVLELMYICVCVLEKEEDDDDGFF